MLENVSVVQQCLKYQDIIVNKERLANLLEDSNVSHEFQTISIKTPDSHLHDQLQEALNKTKKANRSKHSNLHL